MSRSELVNAVRDLSRLGSFFSLLCCCCCCVVGGWPDELTFQTVGVMNVQSPPFQAASRIIGGLPRRRLINGSPSSVNRISVDGASGSYFSGLEDFGRTNVRIAVVDVVELDGFVAAFAGVLRITDCVVVTSEECVVELDRRAEGTVGEDGA